MLYDRALRFLSHKGGATAIEYALIASIVCIGIVASLGTLSDSLNSLWQSIAAGFGN